MQTGENEQALRKIIDFTRFLGILVLILHFYFSCYGAFSEMHLTYVYYGDVDHPISGQIDPGVS
jgi:hypothetical protein